MNVGPIPLVATGTLSGNLPTGAKTLGSAPLASGEAFTHVSLDESKALTGVTFTPFSTPQVSADNANAALMQQQLLMLQEQNQS